MFFTKVMDGAVVIVLRIFERRGLNQLGWKRVKLPRTTAPNRLRVAILRPRSDGVGNRPVGKYTATVAAGDPEFLLVM